jgi:hypothetical protein
MFTAWDEEFDRVCGARITSTETTPLEDSGLWDILHGPSGRETTIKDARDASAKLFRPVPEDRGGQGPLSRR